MDTIGIVPEWNDDESTLTDCDLRRIMRDGMWRTKTVSVYKQCLNILEDISKHLQGEDAEIHKNVMRIMSAATLEFETKDAL